MPNVLSDIITSFETSSLKLVEVNDCVTALSLTLFHLDARAREVYEALLSQERAKNHLIIEDIKRNFERIRETLSQIPGLQESPIKPEPVN